MQVIKKNARIKIKIQDIVYGGNGIHKNSKNDPVIFVKNGIKGQTVLAEITKVKPSYAEAKIINVIVKSPLQKKRIYQKISGAPYFEIDIEHQRNMKTQLVFDVFKKIAGIQNIENYFETLIKSPKTWHYRNKMEYAFSSIIYDKIKQRDIDDFGLGFKKANTWWMVENLDKESGLFDKQWEDSIIRIREFCQKSKLPAWNIPQKKGFFRNLNVRKSYYENKLLIELVTSSEGLNNFKIHDFVDFVLSIHGKKIAGIIHTINDNISDRIDYNKTTSKVVYGKNKINEKIIDLNFEISMSSFFQTNPICAEKLYEKVIDYSKIESCENSIILDLFCGTGTITQLIASSNKKNQVIGVDIVESAIRNAKQSAKKNNIKNSNFYALDINKFLISKPHLTNKIQTIIVDPPRPGISKKSLKKIIELNSKKIIYVSCNPSTQARDIKILMENGYEIDQFSIADQFPHTHHIETIFALNKG
ncbi:MAG: 23S rRNA (uracil(1939)-C(5))-methyltransferase RlmD [Flavobacteriales bacterium]|nr:23S rRNA (uracil(1939)-C(5))-methyltransferase RlmD [Flavobacteriales bacterium]